MKLVTQNVQRDTSFFGASISTRRKLTSILLAAIIFAFLAGLTNLARGRSVIYGTLNAILVGFGVGLFEEFYVQTLRGRWMRSIHPLRSILFYTVVVAVMFVLATNLTHLILYPFYDSPVPYSHLPYVLPIFIVSQLSALSSSARFISLAWRICFI
jgi:adenylate cyclase